LEPPTDWASLLLSSTPAQRFFADPAGRPGAEWPPIEPGRPTILAVGPEGGFTEEERELAVKSGWVPLCLGVNTLRIETAGVAGCACLLAPAPESHQIVGCHTVHCPPDLS
jgi:16S rRNA (uracil1498-N3)-methyltransferase